MKPDNLDYRRTLAAVYLAAFEIDSAAAQYAEIVRRDSSDVDSWFNMARLYQGRRPEQALVVYERLLQRFGPQWEVLLQMAEINGALQTIIGQCSVLEREHPENPWLQRDLATIVRQAQRIAGLLEKMRDATQKRLDEMAAQVSETRVAARS